MRVETALIVAEKVLFIGLLMAVGFLCGKLGLIDRELNRKASELLLLVVSPCLIFSSYQVEYDAALLGNLLLAFGLSVGSFAVQLLCAHLLLPRTRRDAAVEQLSVVYPNCMFLGIPLIEALYGAEGVLYLTAYITCFNVLFWTHGVIVMDGKCDGQQLLKKLCSPALIAIAAGLVLFLLRVRLPGWLLEPVRSISGMNTPLAMLIAGATSSQKPLRSCGRRLRCCRCRSCRRWRCSSPRRARRRPTARCSRCAMGTTAAMRPASLRSRRCLRRCACRSWRWPRGCCSDDCSNVAVLRLAACRRGARML